jgi:hypothetical protein
MFIQILLSMMNEFTKIICKHVTACFVINKHYVDLCSLIKYRFAENVSISPKIDTIISGL